MCLKVDNDGAERMCIGVPGNRTSHTKCPLAEL